MEGGFWSLNEGFLYVLRREDDLQFGRWQLILPECDHEGMADPKRTLVGRQTGEDTLYTCLLTFIS